MNRKKIIRIILAVLAVAALLAAGGCALWKNGFFEKINSVEALREVIADAGVWAGAVYFALQMMTVIVAPIPSNISMMAGALALGFWPAMRAISSRADSRPLGLSLSEPRPMLRTIFSSLGICTRA